MTAWLLQQLMASCVAVNALRRTRLAMQLSQSKFAALLGVAEETYRMWDSARRRPPRVMVYRARRLHETEGGLDLIRFGGRVHYVDLVSSSFVEESLQVLGGIRISIRCSLVVADEHPVVI